MPDLSEKPGLNIPANSLLGPGYQLDVPDNDSLSPEAEAQPTQNGSSKPTQKSKTSITFNIG